MSSRKTQARKWCRSANYAMSIVLIHICWEIFLMASAMANLIYMPSWKKCRKYKMRPGNYRMARSIPSMILLATSAAVRFGASKACSRECPLFAGLHKGVIISLRIDRCWGLVSRDNGIILRGTAVAPVSCTVAFRLSPAAPAV